ncbi:site-specific integrase [Candidimonas nitroreducens]|nr:site-specific integrase [Candidimonas nitroreducens]
MTITALLGRYLLEESSRKASASDDKQRAETIKRVLGGFGVTELTAAHLSHYKRSRLAVRAPQTVTHELNLLHRAYVVGVNEWGLVLPQGIPCTGRPKLPPGRNRRVRPHEVRGLLACTGSRELAAIVLLAVETAMRRGEILGMRWEHINLLRCSVLLPHTKNGDARTVPLSTAAVAVLQPLQRDSGPVFSLTPRCASQAFKRAVDRAGLFDLHFHDLRHEATSRLFEKGLNVIEVARITGHKSLAMLNRYAHLDVSGLVEKLAAAS